MENKGRRSCGLIMILARSRARSHLILFSIGLYNSPLFFRRRSIIILIIILIIIAKNTVVTWKTQDRRVKMIPEKLSTAVNIEVEVLVVAVKLCTLGLLGGETGAESRKLGSTAACKRAKVRGKYKISVHYMNSDVNIN